MNIARKDILFILGSGASVDSGLPTYRGPEGIYTSSDLDPEDYFSKINIAKDIDKVWDFFRPLYKQISKATPGLTYTKLAEVLEKHPNSTIITQNIDGLAQQIIKTIPIIEVHGTSKTMTCMNKHCMSKHNVNLDKPECSCGYWCRPDIVCYGENLDPRALRDCFIQSKKAYKYVTIIGTTVQFSYLVAFIHNAKRKGAKVIHINPDSDYGLTIKKNEISIRATAFDGLVQFMENYD